MKQSQLWFILFCTNRTANSHRSAQWVQPKWSSPSELGGHWPVEQSFANGAVSSTASNQVGILSWLCQVHLFNPFAIRYTNNGILFRRLKLVGDHDSDHRWHYHSRANRLWTVTSWLSRQYWSLDISSTLRGDGSAPLSETYLKVTLRSSLAKVEAHRRMPYRHRLPQLIHAPSLWCWQNRFLLQFLHAIKVNSQRFILTFCIRVVSRNLSVIALV